MLSGDNKNTKAGFTLVEMAVIITALGLLIAPFFAYLATQQNEKTLVAEEETSAKITAALSVFIANRGRYPCPADLSLGPEDASNNFGREERVPAAGAVTGCDATAVDNSSGLYFGAVPTQALGLPAENAVNQHGWKYFYVVTQGLVVDAAQNGAIRIEIDADDDSAVGGAGDVIIPDAQFVVINPGRDGKGSVPLTGNPAGGGAPFACAGAAKDVENCSAANNIFHDFKSAYNPNINNANYYDDILTYSLVRSESTFWEIDPIVGVNGTFNIITRNDGNVGIGTGAAAPTGKLDIGTGNLIVNGEGDSISNTNFRVEGNLDGTVPFIKVDEGPIISGATAEGMDAGASISTGSAFYYP